MKQNITWDTDKNRWLASHPDRGVCFEDVVAALDSGGLLDDIEHPNQPAFKNQRMLIVLIGGYVYCVPYVESKDGLFLKTVYPSRKFKAIYLPDDDDN